ncbi:MAG: hypothetical protein LBT38_06035 [Deltaproteobacteria bacterium]|jgi:ssDNA-binding Zn-finger/Zn-ribbon topoisomerase 1|nr:hypothetical protein [Deltaproteobacteria bacterium]
MSNVKKGLFFVFFLPLLAAIALICADRSEAGVLKAQADNSLVASADALVANQALNAQGQLGSLQTVSGRDRSDYFDDRRDDKRYPKCRKIQNHDTKRYRECVQDNYYKKPVSHGKKKWDRKSWDDQFDDRRDDKRYPKCRKIQNHDSRKYRECVWNNYYHNSYR